MILKGYSKRLIAAGIGLTLVSFVFVFPYVGFTVNKQYANVTGGPISVTGLDPRDPLNLYIFAILFFGVAGLLVRGFI